MQIVIAGGSGFLGSPLAETYAEDSHDVRVLTRGLAPGESRHESGTGVPGITRVGWTARRTVRAVGGGHRRRRCGDQPRRRVDRREALDAAAQGGAARQPHPRDPQPRRGDQGRGCAAARLHQFERDRLLRNVDRRRHQDRSVAAGRRLPRPSLRGLGGRGGQGGARRHATRHHPQPASSSSDRAERWRR